MTAGNVLVLVLLRKKMGYPLNSCFNVFLLLVLGSRGFSSPILQELRLSLANPYSSYSILEPEGKGTYAFGYDIDDPETGNTQFRDEERKPDGSVSGKYGWVSADNTVFIVNYIADEHGYRANIESAPIYKARKIQSFFKRGQGSS
ncbi:adult-specific rigid cuticular protein 15.7-like [Euwallacea similis]|uniref:adult-specific rigid cuticular protein 15.7-like n=1 Tax=Euwallacea similis TaxID=1736056 RepID=UPI00344E1955